MSEIVDNVPEAELTPEQAKSLFFQEMNKTIPGSPTLAQVETWKKQIGRVRMIQFSDEEVYFFRPLKSTEYRAIVNEVRGIQDVNEQTRLLKEKVVAKACLFPVVNPVEIGALYAGTVDSLHAMIMQASNFLTEQEITIMVREL